MIDTEALRKKVIDLAIQGKLTQQLPEDGNAEDLYAQIQKEKAKLIKEGKIKKEKLLPEISDDEIPFAIPKTWKWVRFGDLMWNRDSERIPVSVADRKKLSKNYDYYGASGVIDKVEKYIFDEKLLLIGEDGANLVSRSTPIAFIAKGKYWVNNHAHVLGCYKYDYLDFVMHYINSIILIPFVTGTAQPKLNQENMNKIPVPLPPLAEQRRIVEKLDDVLAQIDIIDALQQQYEFDREILKGKIIEAGIRGELTEQLPEDGNAEDLYEQIQEEKKKHIREGKIKKEKPLPEISDDEIPFKIPSNWKWAYMGEVFSHNTGKALNNADSEGVPLEYITTSNMYWDHFELDGLKKMYFKESEIDKCTIRKGDLLICEGGDIGRSAIWTFDYDMRIQNHIHKLRGYCGIVHKYYYYVMRNYKDMGLIDGRGIGLQGFSSKRVHSLVVPLPPLEEQKRIVEKIQSILSAL